MEGLHKNPENGVIGLDDSGPHNFNITVSHGPKQYQVVVPSNSTFGDLKSVIAQKIGLEPDTHKLLFRGKEKDDDDHLQAAGVKDNSKVLLMEDITSVPKSPEVETSVTSEGDAAVSEVGPEAEKLADVPRSPEKVEASVISRGGEAVAEVRKEVDKLAEQVAALQAVVDGGTQVDDKDFLYLTEMLMRQLLKLDSIEAEGEGKVQRKMEVRRVQSFVDALDVLKSRNANINEKTCVTTQWKTYEPGCENVSTISIQPSSTSTLPSYDPAPAPTSTTSCPTSATAPSLTPSISSTDAPNPFSLPGTGPVPLSSPSRLPSSTNVTQDWERFD